MCLESIINQDYKNIEIVVVDNYSTDNTVEIAKMYTQLVFEWSPERSSQVNYGVSKSSGKYIYRVDSDFVLEREVISQAVNLAEQYSYAGVLIHNTSDPSVSFWAKVRKFERDMYDNDNLNVAVRFILKDAFVSVGGFDTRLTIGEDYDLHNRIIKRYKIGRITAKETHLGEYKTIMEVIRKHYYYGKTAGAFLRKNRLHGIKQLVPIKKSYVRHWDNFLSNPSLAVGFMVYQAIRYVSAVIGLLTSALVRVKW
jgi:glycosyltransferase involved in cell wall biosynthesis